MKSAGILNLIDLKSPLFIVFEFVYFGLVD